MSNNFVGLDFADFDVTFGELREFVEQTADMTDDSRIAFEFNLNQEPIAFKAFV